MKLGRIALLACLLVQAAGWPAFRSSGPPMTCPFTPTRGRQAGRLEL